MWRNWNPLNPPINEQSSDEEQHNYESAGDDPENLVSPNRPHQSPSASPRALLRPDPPRVEEVLAEVGQQLRALPTREQRVANRNAVREAAEAAAAAAEEVVADMAEFDAENGVDGDKAQEHARSIKVEFSAADINFWFSELEGEMVIASVKSQWLKKTILQRNLPTRQKEDVKSLLTLTKAQGGNDIYLRIKRELVRIYAHKPADSYKKALSRQMTGLPSQLGYQIVNDICKKATKLDGCCCEGAAQALWSMSLPVNIRAHISNMDFTKDTYKNVFEAADQVFLSSKQVTVAAIGDASGASALDETLPAFTTQNQPQVAAVRGQRGGQRGQGRGGRGQRGGGRGGSQNQSQASQSQSQRSNNNSNSSGRARGPRHSSNPPESCCDRHYRHGDQAFFCLAPLTCPWVSKIAARP